MSASKVEGFDDLVKNIETMGKVGNKIANKALRSAGEIIVKQQKKDGVHNTGKGAAELKVGSVKTAKASKNKYVQVGITKDSDWNNVRGVYFQHHGYRNHRNGRYYAGSLWMDKSFEKAKNDAATELIKYISKELKL